MKRLKCRRITLSNEKTAICVPITGTNIAEIKEQSNKINAMKPDLIEWRADYFIKNEDDISAGLDAIASETDIPLIFTFRTANEGGEQEATFEQYANYCKKAAKVSKDYNIEFVDLEMYSNKGDGIKELADFIHSRETMIIGSNHHFGETPTESKMLEILKDTEQMGADVCKIAVMPNDKRDVTRLINASKKADSELNSLIITMSMSELGAVTRVCTAITKSAVTFAAGVNASAPGQVPIDVVRNLLRYKDGCTMNGSISLIGFMGTGKTTVSQALARITGFEEVDVDRYIVKTQGMEINEIFEKYGESGFRDIETEALREVSKKPNCIISCGGGAVLRGENVDILKENGVIVRLTATPETIFDRVKYSTHRPILNNDMSLEHVKELMAGREPRYSAVADISVNVDSNDRILTCNDILSQLERRGNIGLK